MELTHKVLCDIAVKWLKRTSSAGGHGCHVAVSEVSSGSHCESPDAIGFRATGDHSDGSVVAEAKTSRSDFKADKNKPHRNGEALGMGNWRYYICPTGLIKHDEIPDKFGLLYVNSRGHVEPIISPFLTSNQCVIRQKLIDMRFEADTSRESYLMIRLLSRISNPEKLSNDLKKARNGQANFQKKYEKLNAQYNEILRLKHVPETHNLLSRNSGVKKITI